MGRRPLLPCTHVKGLHMGGNVGKGHSGRGSVPLVMCGVVQGVVQQGVPGGTGPSHRTVAPRVHSGRRGGVTTAVHVAVTLAVAAAVDVGITVLH